VASPDSHAKGLLIKLIAEFGSSTCGTLVLHNLWAGQAADMRTHIFCVLLQDLRREQPGISLQDKHAVVAELLRHCHLLDVHAQYEPSPVMTAKLLTGHLQPCPWDTPKSNTLLPAADATLQVRENDSP